MTDSLSTKSQTSLFTMSSDKLHIDSFIFPNGDRYDGSWDQDKMHGTGRLTFSNGTSYEGEFQSNFYQGLGTYTWPDGAQYTGLWQDSKAIGKAEYFDPNLGILFVGMADKQEIHMRYKLNFS